MILIQYSKNNLDLMGKSTNLNEIMFVISANGVSKMRPHSALVVNLLGSGIELNCFKVLVTLSSNITSTLEASGRMQKYIYQCLYEG